MFQISISKISILFTSLVLTGALVLSSFSRSIAKGEEENHLNQIKLENKASTCNLAVSVSDYNSFKDYNISIWLNNHSEERILVPFNLASLMNKNVNLPILNLSLLSSDGSTMYLMKNGSKKFMLRAKERDCIDFSANNLQSNFESRFKFNIKDIFGDAVPEHNEFFIEYKYEPKSFIGEMNKEDYVFSYSAYNLHRDTLVGNVLSSIVSIKGNDSATPAVDTATTETLLVENN